MILDHPVDPDAVVAPPQIEMDSFQIFTSNSPFEQGGEPTNDEERYHALSCGEVDYSPIHSADYKFVLSTGVFASLEPEEEIFLDVAMVAGPDLQGLLENAANAVIVHQGCSYDRDGDPGTGPDGKEFAVKWLGPDDLLNNSFVHGHVFNDSAEGAALVNALVQVVGTDRSAYTDDSGYYFISVEPGLHDLEVSYETLGGSYRTGLLFQEGGLEVEDFHLSDVAGPLISDTTTYPNTGDTEGPYTIDATVCDISGPENVTLYYTSSSTGGPHAVSMYEVDPGSDLMRAEIPGQSEGSLVQYWFGAEDGLGNTSVSPDGAPFQLHVFQVGGQQVVLLEDDLESETGWETDSTQDSATDGFWERVDPNAVSFNGFELQPEDDHTPGAGVLCYITGNDPPGSPMGTDDVDGGSTTLFSPWIDISATSEVFLTYYRWFSSGYSPADDLWKVEATGDGATWVELESTSLSNRMWLARTFLLDDYLENHNQVRLRFSAEDGGTDSCVEAGVDDLSVVGLSILQDSESPQVSLVAPDGGEQISEEFSVIWNASDDLGVVDICILLSVDGGETFPQVLYTGPANGTWQWQHPAVSSDHCRLLIIAYDSEYNHGIAVSSADFSVNGTTGAELAPHNFSLAQNIPNPFNPKTTIRFSLSKKQKVRLQVFDVRGRMVRTLVSETMGEGLHEVRWDGNDQNGSKVAAGGYFYRLEAGKNVETRKMVLIK